MRTADVCPTCSTYINAKCVIYNGPYLTTLNINTLDSVETAFERLDTWASTISGGEGGNATLTEEIVASINVGGITVGQTFPIGTSLTTIVKNLVSPTLLPNILTQTSLTVSNVSPVVLEVGTMYTKQILTNFSQGSIQSKNGSPNVPLVGPATSTIYSSPGVSPSGLISTPIFLGSNQWDVTVAYSAGTIPYYDSSGNVSNVLDAQRGAGTLVANTPTITGRYRYWYAVGALGSTPNTSFGIRALGGTGFATSTNFDITFAANTKEVSFYIPQSVSVVSVVYVQSSNADVTLTFVSSNINVEDAGGNLIPYTKYKATIGGIGYPDVATYKVTIN